ncbi:hypothetical protein BOW53_02240 [Solemya pervernicosa gill symbiont]|uniref:8-oxo-dGTP diphosphatase n=2 Tax=Gammaproteobacteria incertae sedis TaxID=118884 RepID=A0A1T2LAA6_9GAMM|nr:hypothetical protein BOW53_02240 [Solemya pervernicosa gill symbiont]QKQ28204.1 Nudix family hydrolase [Candidatus Reidiella endopervernicosa]
MNIVVAAIIDREERVLLALRHKHLHQGGLWEFPGGKIEAGESEQAALVRELDEELGIIPCRYRRLISVPFDYADRTVVLHVWRVDEYQGEASGREEQPIEWQPIAKLREIEFPAANRPIVSALELPPHYLITGEPADNSERFLLYLQGALDQGIRLVQLRAKRLDQKAYLELANAALEKTRSIGAKLLLNATPEMVEAVGADGVHLDSQRLLSLQSRPLDNDYYVAASCHSAEQLAHAAAIDVDFAVLSPVQKTVSHPDVKPIGWQRFAAMVNDQPMPVYALGGMSGEMVSEAYRCGAQGVAAISAFWAAN